MIPARHRGGNAWQRQCLTILNLNVTPLAGHVFLSSTIVKRLKDENAKKFSWLVRGLALVCVLVIVLAYSLLRDWLDSGPISQERSFVFLVGIALVYVVVLIFLNLATNAILRCFPEIKAIRERLERGAPFGRPDT